jgi:CheY-like chemotaxis protein
MSMGRSPPRFSAATSQSNDFEESLAQAIWGERVRVLVVDSNARSRRTLANMCELFGCSTSLARDGLEAEKAARSTMFDLVLVDVDTAIMDGLEATHAIRDQAERPTPVFAVTRNHAISDLRSYADAGMVGAIPKPVRASRVLEAITTAIESHKGF